MRARNKSVSGACDTGGGKKEHREEGGVGGGGHKPVMNLPTHSAPQSYGGKNVI